MSVLSNRMGIRLEGLQILWTCKNTSEGGLHPGNMLDNRYMFGTISVNGDTPVIVTCDGPDVGR